MLLSVACDINFYTRMTSVHVCPQGMTPVGRPKRYEVVTGCVIGNSWLSYPYIASESTRIILIKFDTCDQQG